MTEDDLCHSSSLNTPHSGSSTRHSGVVLGRNPEQHSKSSFFSLRKTLSSFQQFFGWNPQKLPFDLIDGHYFYPDGVAIEKVASKYDIPFTCTARGTDINLIPKQPKALEMIKKVFQQASHMMTVCQALKDEMISLGADETKITTLRNGVDLDLFRSSDENEQQKLKKELNIPDKLVMSVGWLIERKGHYLVIEAIKSIESATLAIAGDGPDLNHLKTLVKRHGVEERVKFLGSLSQPVLNKWFKAADATVLASSREGWANVLLESMASGTAVVATKVWGTPEVVTCSDAGFLVDRNADDVVRGINLLLENPSTRTNTRKYAEQFDWQSTSQGQHTIFTKMSKSK